jgi:hypothetical protein
VLGGRDHQGVGSGGWQVTATSQLQTAPATAPESREIPWRAGRKPRTPEGCLHRSQPTAAV